MAMLAPQSPSHQMQDQNTRVEDYLNDKLQTHADLDSIDSLLETVRHQQKQLLGQLHDAETALGEAHNASKSYSTSLHREVEKFKTMQANIDRRLMIVTQSETSDDAIKKFNDSIEKLGRLDVAKGYMDLLNQVDLLSIEARRNFKASPKDALKPYISLRNLAIALEQAQPAAEYAAPHLVAHIDKTVSTLWKQMKNSYASDFEKTLAKMQWPGKDVKIVGDLQKEWTSGVERLLELQEPELRAHEDESGRKASQNEPLVLLPLEVMVKTLELRFSYHFDGDRATNRLDKPEFFLSHLDTLLSTYDGFFTLYLQPVLLRQFKGSNLALSSVYIDSTSALITALLPMQRRKIFSLLPQLTKQPQLLSHFMHELMNFDLRVKEDWDYDGGSGVEGWKGLTWEILVKRDWFGRWLQVEKDFALSRYQNIIEPPESGEIDYDSVDPGVTKPTKAAIRVNDLLETVTDRYRPLTSFSQKLRFLIDIQIAIFDRFHNRLHSSLEAYLTLTSSIARTVQGVSREEQSQLQGLGGVERLCRVYGSAEYLEKKMRDWSDDVFFLELWDELQFRARENSKSGRNIAGDMSIEDVANRTSSVVGSDEDLSGALFDETAGAFRRLRIRTESIMQDVCSSNIRETLRPYGRINPWSSISSNSESLNVASLNISAELDTVIQQLSTYLSFLAKVLAEAPLRRICRQVNLFIQSFLWDTVLMRNNFSAYGSAQFMRDVSAMWEVVDRYVGIGQGRAGMRKLGEALEMLTLPAGLEVKAGEGVEADSRVGEVTLTLWDVEKRIFLSNESAREVLEELGINTLTESEARNVLEKRIELGH